MTERDIVISEQVSRNIPPTDPRPQGYEYEHATPHDAMQWMADYTSRPSAHYLGGHGESVPLPLPAVSGGSGDPPLPPSYTGGYLRPDEYERIEGTGQQLVRDAMQVYFSVVDGMAVERTVEPDNDTAEIPHIPCYRNHDVEQLQREDEYLSQQTVYPALVDTFRDLVILGVSLWIIVAIGVIGWLAAGWIAIGG